MHVYVKGTTFLHFQSLQVYYTTYLRILREYKRYIYIYIMCLYAKKTLSRASGFHGGCAVIAAYIRRLIYNTSSSSPSCIFAFLFDPFPRPVVLPTIARAYYLGVVLSRSDSVGGDCSAPKLRRAARHWCQKYSHITAG